MCDKKKIDFYGHQFSLAYTSPSLHRVECQTSVYTKGVNETEIPTFVLVVFFVFQMKAIYQLKKQEQLLISQILTRLTKIDSEKMF